MLVHCKLTQVHTPRGYRIQFSESFAICHCCERNFDYLNLLSTRTCGAGQPHVGLCPILLVTSNALTACTLHIDWNLQRHCAVSVQHGFLVGATENAGPGQCRTWKMTDHVAGGGKCRTYKNDGSNRRLTMQHARPVTGWQDASLSSRHN